MFKYWKKIDALNHMNRLLLTGIGLLMLVIIGLFLVILTAPKRVEFWLSPQMIANGGLIKADDIPNEYVHGFVSALMPIINTWSKEGKKEFIHNRHAFYYYFTPRHQQLMARTFTSFQNAQLFDRTQVASLYRFMEPDDIKRLGNNIWEVHVVLRITQRLTNENPMVIADKVVDYHLRVVKVSLSKLHNPFQLALDGYTQPEHLLIDLLNQNSKGETHGR